MRTKGAPGDNRSGDQLASGDSEAEKMHNLGRSLSYCNSPTVDPGSVTVLPQLRHGDDR